MPYSSQSEIEAARVANTCLYPQTVLHPVHVAQPTSTQLSWCCFISIKIVATQPVLLTHRPAACQAGKTSVCLWRAFAAAQCVMHSNDLIELHIDLALLPGSLGNLILDGIGVIHSTKVVAWP